MAFRDIRKQRKWLSAEEVRLLAIGLFVLGLWLAANVSLARTVPGGEWLFMRWSGARAFLARQTDQTTGIMGARDLSTGEVFISDQQTEPYGREIAEDTQEVAYGRIAFSSEYRYVLNDPFFIVMLYSPLAFLQDFTLVRGIWMLLAEVALIAIGLLAFNLSEWQPPRWLYTLLLGFALLHYFSLYALVTASPAILLTLLYLYILLALRSFADELAGVLLALVAYQWEIGGLFFLFILFFVVANRRWRVLAGFVMALFVLLAVSFLIYPDWGLSYIRAVLSDWYQGMNLSLGPILSLWFPRVNFPLGRIVAIILGIVLFLEWVNSVDAPFRRVVWTAALSLAATPLMGFAIFPSNYVVLVLPFILMVALVWERWQRFRVFRIVLLLLFALLVPFGLYLRSVFIYDELVTHLIAIFPPIAAIAGLYWMRWWVLHSPRTLLTRMGEYR